MCSGALLTEQAGGVICQLDGKGWSPTSRDALFAATLELRDEILRVLKS
jgi:Archaeal fructose-1,6-bisphosphatase and related enzymes of inositol monophosphatase family